jgi:hypothetical protein
MYAPGVFNCMALESILFRVFIMMDRTSKRDFEWYKKGDAVSAETCKENINRKSRPSKNGRAAPPSVATSF